LHYNWHRQYDPTVGRYTQPDPLGFVDGPSVYGYVKGAPQARIDIKGLNSTDGEPPGTITCTAARLATKLYCRLLPSRCRWWDSCQDLFKKIHIKNLCGLYQRTLTLCYGDSGDHGTRLEDVEKGIDNCNEYVGQKKCLQCQ
jgi:hypothetical protein